MRERGSSLTRDRRLSGLVAEEEGRLMTAARYSLKVKGEQREMTLLMAVSLTEVRHIASCSAAKSLWLKHGKVRPQVVGINRGRFRGKRIVGKVKKTKGRSRTSNSSKEKIKRFRRERRACSMLCLCFGDDPRNTPRGRVASLSLSSFL